MTPSKPTEFQIDADLLKACIHCGICLPVCPTYGITGSEAESPRGRLYLMKAYGDGELDNAKQLTTHLDACLGCVACESACPSGVQYGQLLTTARTVLAPKKPFFYRMAKRFMFSVVLPRKRVLELVKAIVVTLQQSNLGEVFTPRLKALESRASDSAWQWNLLPPLPVEPSPFKAGQQYPAVSTSSERETANEPRPVVALMLGCVMDTMFHPVHQATVDVLTVNGYNVVIPEQTCCGALALHDGEQDIALRLAKQNIELVMQSNPDFIVLNSAGCGASMRDYAHLFKDDAAWADKAREFSSKVIDVMVLLAQKPIVKPTRVTSKKITYHGACHLHHAQKIQTQPFDVLFQIPGLNFVPLPGFDRCCGSAGIYNIEQPELSQLLLVEKMMTINATSADIVVTGNPGCLMQIMAGAKHLENKPAVMHPVELLAYVYEKSDHPAFNDSPQPEDTAEVADVA